MFCAGGVISMGSSFGFLGGLLWGRGRLLAPPTASVEPHNDTHINTTTANMQCHTPAIPTLTVITFSGGIAKVPLFLNSFPLLFYGWFCLPLSALHCPQSTWLSLTYRYRKKKTAQIDKKQETKNFKQRTACEVKY